MGQRVLARAPTNHSVGQLVAITAAMFPTAPDFGVTDFGQRTFAWVQLPDGYTDRLNVEAWSRAIETAVPTFPTPEQLSAQQAQNAVILRDRARTALATNQAFLALTPPTQAQVVAQVRALTQQNEALIRLVVGALSDTT